MKSSSYYVKVLEEVLPDLFRIQIPLPENPLGYLNSYVVKEDRSAFIVDSGFNMDECYNVIVKALSELSIDIRKISFLITHLHPDHIGLVDRFRESKIYVSSVEAELISGIAKDPNNYLSSKVFSYYKANGFPEEELRKVLEHHPAIKYSIKRTDFQLVNDGEILEYGRYKLKVILTPGHTPGHICLYEPNRKILISGDHILFDITPNITWWPNLEDSLNEYLKSLDKTYELEVVKTLPAHRGIGGNHRERINEIREHHERRLKETLNALERGAKTAWDVAQHISWNIKFKSWTELPSIQKWFAVGETIAHLIHLEKEGLAKSKEKNGRIIYSKA